MAKYVYKGTEQPNLVGRVYDGFRLPPAGDFDLEAFHAWADEVGFDCYESDRDECMVVATLSGPKLARPGDWIMKSEKGYFCPVCNASFEEDFAPYQEGAANAEGKA